MIQQMTTSSIGPIPCSHLLSVRFTCFTLFRRYKIFSHPILFRAIQVDLCRFRSSEELPPRDMELKQSLGGRNSLQEFAAFLFLLLPRPTTPCLLPCDLFRDSPRDLHGRPCMPWLATGFLRLNAVDSCPVSKASLSESGAK